MTPHDAMRRSMIARAQLTDDELATAAARFGIVAGPIPLNAGGDETYPDRMHEAAQVWAVIVTGMRELYHGSTTRTDWPYDASAERFELSPAGRWHYALPPIYAAGSAVRDAAEFVADHPMHDLEAATDSAVRAALFLSQTT